MTSDLRGMALLRRAAATEVADLRLRLERMEDGPDIVPIVEKAASLASGVLFVGAVRCSSLEQLLAAAAEGRGDEDWLCLAASLGLLINPLTVHPSAALKEAYIKAQQAYVDEMGHLTCLVVERGVLVGIITPANLRPEKRGRS